MQHNRIAFKIAKQILRTNPIAGVSGALRGTACPSITRVVNTLLTPQTYPPPTLQILSITRYKSTPTFIGVLLSFAAHACCCQTALRRGLFLLSPQ